MSLRQLINSWESTTSHTASPNLSTAWKATTILLTALAISGCETMGDAAEWTGDVMMVPIEKMKAKPTAGMPSAGQVYVEDDSSEPLVRVSGILYYKDSVEAGRPVVFDPDMVDPGVCDEVLRWARQVRAGRNTLIGGPDKFEKQQLKQCEAAQQDQRRTIGWKMPYIRPSP